MPRFLFLWLAASAWAGVGAAAAAQDLLHAARSGDTAAVVAQLSAGADVNVADGEGVTALYIAADRGFVDIAKVLLDAGADPALPKKTPYGSGGAAPHAAAAAGHVDVLRLLLEAGVDPNLPDPDAGPPLHKAIAFEQTETIALLRAFGAGPKAAPSVDHLVAGSDLAAGERIAWGCKLCHDLTKEPSGETLPGATLWDILDRPVASIDGFAYSNALTEMGGVWTYAALNSYIANPKAFLPGTTMYSFRGIPEPQRRAALLLFLRSLSDDPKPLP